MSFIGRQWFTKLPFPSKSHAGQTIIVTGSNIGLGLEAAKHYVRLGAATVILAVRSVDKGEAAKQKIEKETGCKSGVVQVWQVDLGSYESVKQFNERVNKELPRLDILLENAAIARGYYSRTEDNETQITVNVISTFLMAFGCLPKLKETAQKYNVRPVISIVSSGTHAYTQFPEGDVPNGQIINGLNDEKKADMSARYATSKLLEVFVVREMAEKRPARSYPVTINSLCPGLCHSELGRESGWGLWLLKQLFARTTEVGSRVLVLTTELGPESHGKWCADAVPTPASALVESSKGFILQERVYEEVVERLEKISPGVTKNL